MSATSEYVGYNPGATALFQQTGGSNASSFILIGSGGRYTLSGGTLNITGNGGISNQGIIDFTNSDATLAIGGSCIVDLSQANLTNVAAMTVSVGANSLLIVPAGFDPTTGFAQYSSLGLTHTVGTTLTVPAGQGFGGLGSIGDPVNCQGTITATAGAINLSGGLTLSGSGTVNLGSGNLTTNDLLSGMSGGSLYVAAHYVGNGGTGTFTQTGGNNNIGNALYLGNNAGDSGTYNLSGTGQLSAPMSIWATPARGPSRSPAGPTVSILAPSYLVTTSAAAARIASAAAASFRGPTPNTWASPAREPSRNPAEPTTPRNLYLGYNAGSSGMYNLSGNGQLSASYGESVGYSGTGTFTQSGGTTQCRQLPLSRLQCGQQRHVQPQRQRPVVGRQRIRRLQPGRVSHSSSRAAARTRSAVLSIGSGGTYLLAGGVLQVNGGLLNQGIFAGNGTPATLSNSNSILDLSSGTWQDLGAISVSMGANSLLIVPAGFNTSTDFAQYSSLGLTHTLGTTLTVPAGQGFVGSDSISDPVNCQGTITAVTGGAINLSGGLMLSGTGTVNLGSGTLTTNDLLSGISGGSLMVASQYVGSGGTGTFTQTGGINSIGSYYSGSLCLGNNAGDSGTYNLSGSGGVSAYVEYAGYSGTGSFTQTGGTNSTYYLYLGNNAGGSGTYSLSGGQLSASYGSTWATPAREASRRPAATNSMSYGDFYLGYNAGSSGTYNLGGGQLSGPYFESVGLSGTGSFTQSGGTNSTYYLYLGNNAGGSGIVQPQRQRPVVIDLRRVRRSSGTGTFTQTGGTNSISYGYLYLGNYAGGSGSYSLSGGQLSASYGEYVGYSGTGSFTQTGGTNAVASDLYLGYNAGSSGTYNLGGSGQLSAASEYVGYTAGATALFQQTGGTNTVSNLSIGSGGTYLLAGGTLQVNGSLVNQGIFAGSNTPASLSVNCLWDLSSGTWQNLGDTSVSMGANSLLIVPPGFDPSTDFAQYSSLGLTHTLGTTLTVLAAQGFGGSGSISDPVNCQGTITAASGGAINLSGGLILSGTGAINLGNGTLTTNDLLSGISGGSLMSRTNMSAAAARGRSRRPGGTTASAPTTPAPSTSATTPATAARTTSAATANCRRPRSTWATPARGPSRRPGGTTVSAMVIFISATMPAAAVRTALAAARSLNPTKSTWATPAQEHSRRPVGTTAPTISISATTPAAAARTA